MPIASRTSQLVASKGTVCRVPSAASDGTFYHVLRFHDDTIRGHLTHRGLLPVASEKAHRTLPDPENSPLGDIGFNVHSQGRTSDKEEAVRVGKYMIRFAAFQYLL
ncbi:MAG: hypothetical protein V3V48_02410 [Candidatus Aminicenantaceae bacterium]